MGKNKVVDLDRARQRIYRRREEQIGLVCPRCGQGGAAVYAHMIHCSDLWTEEKIDAMTGRYGLDSEGARATVETWERPAEVRTLRPNPAPQARQP